MRQQARLVSVNLPLPPSVNKAFAGRRGSHLTQKSAAYRFWERQVLEEYGRGQFLPVLTPGKYGFWLDLPPIMRGDIDNRVKLVSDILKRSASGEGGMLGVVVDDAHMKGLHIAFAEGTPADRCTVTVVTLPEWPAYVTMRMEP